MSSQTAVTPIIVGFPFKENISFVDTAGAPLANFDLTTATRLFGQARVAAGANNPVLATFDSGKHPQNLSLINANTFSFSLTSEETSKLRGVPSIWIDFAREDLDVWSLLPGQVQWPVLLPITAPPLGPPGPTGPTGSPGPTGSQGSGGGGGGIVGGSILIEPLTVTAVNTLSPIPGAGGRVAILVVNGQSFLSTALAPAFTIAGGVVDWNPANAAPGVPGGLNLAVTDTVGIIFPTTAPGSPLYIGPIGATGPQGSSGAAGATGPQGATGSQGSQGPQGATGPSGPAGPPGVGATGATGPAGATGGAGSTDAAALTGATLAANVTASSLTSVGTLSGLTLSSAANTTLQVVGATSGVRGGLSADTPTSGDFFVGSFDGAPLALGSNNATQAVVTAQGLAILPTTASTSKTSGALVVAGGVGVGGSAHVGGDVYVEGDLIVGGLGATPVMTALTVTGVNTLSALPRTASGMFAMLFLDEGVFPLASGAFTLSGTSVIWNAAIAKVTLNPDDVVAMFYSH